MKLGLVAAAICAVVVVIWAFAVRRPETSSPPVQVEPTVPTPSVNVLPPVRPVDSYRAPAVADPRLAGFVDRKAAGDRTGPDFATRFRQLHDPKDIAAVASVMLDPKDDDTVRHEAIELLRRSGYAQLDDDLISIFRNPIETEKFRSWVVQHIGVNALAGDPVARSRLTQVLGEALDDPQVKVRCEALFALSNLGDFKVGACIKAWLDPSKAEPAPIRAIAIRCARLQDKRDQIPVIRTHARDPDEVVCIAALVALSEWGDVESRAACESAVKSTSKRLQTCGRLALERLDKASQKAGANSATSAEVGP